MPPKNEAKKWIVKTSQGQFSRWVFRIIRGEGIVKGLNVCKRVASMYSSDALDEPAITPDFSWIKTVAGDGGGYRVFDIRYGIHLGLLIWTCLNFVSFSWLCFATRSTNKKTTYDFLTYVLPRLTPTTGCRMWIRTVGSTWAINNDSQHPPLAKPHPDGS